MAVNVRECLSSQQMEVLLNELEKRPLLVSGKITGNVTKQSLKEMWNEVSASVNSQPGCNISGEALKKRYFQYRSRVKAKAATIRFESNRTGGGPKKIPPLTPNEERLLQLMGHDFVFGLQNVLELGNEEGCSMEESICINASLNENSFEPVQLKAYNQTEIQPSTEVVSSQTEESLSRNRLNPYDPIEVLKSQSTQLPRKRKKHPMNEPDSLPQLLELQKESNQKLESLEMIMRETLNVMEKRVEVAEEQNRILLLIFQQLQQNSNPMNNNQ